MNISEQRPLTSIPNILNRSRRTSETYCRFISYFIVQLLMSPLDLEDRLMSSSSTTSLTKCLYEGSIIDRWLSWWPRGQSMNLSVSILFQKIRMLSGLISFWWSETEVRRLRCLTCMNYATLTVKKIKSVEQLS